MNIRTEEDTTGFAPRHCRYSAVDDDVWDGAEDSRNRSTVGYGATPDAAVADLVALLADDLAIDADWLREARRTTQGSDA
jgi:hypothetical protein